MSAVELDLPVLITADQIRRREFVTTRRGYDPDQVRDYLQQLADQVDLMASMVRDARLQAEAAIRSNAAPREDPYERLARRVASVIREADEAAERLTHEGRRYAERILSEARNDADRIRTDSQAKAEEARAQAELALRDAKERADRTLAGLSTRRQVLVDQLAQMQDRLLGVARDLEAAIVTPEMAISADLIADGVPVGSGASEDGPPADAGDVVEVGEDVDASSQRSEPVVPSGLDDPAYEDLWDGTETIGLEVPDIPPLDLSWGDEEDQAEPDD